MMARSTRGYGYERERARRQAEEVRKARESPVQFEAVTSAPRLTLGLTAAAGNVTPSPGVTAQIGAEDGRTVRRRTGRVLECGWCGTPITLKRTGRLPRWCSARCRQRAWEQERAVASGRAAVRVVDRHVVVEPRDDAEWIDLLVGLATQIRRGRVGGTAL